jgi:hypothetical protein
MRPEVAYYFSLERMPARRCSNAKCRDLSACMPERGRSQSGGHLPTAPAGQAGAQAGFGEYLLGMQAQGLRPLDRFRQAHCGQALGRHSKDSLTLINKSVSF